MYQLTIDQLDDLARGAAILGSGGGGCPAADLLHTKFLLETYGPVSVMPVENLREDDLVLPIGFMGAPLVCIERLNSGKEVQQLIEQAENRLGKKVSVLMPTEIGGSNAFAPLGAAAQLGLPVLDADTIGRAFPQLQMTSCTVHGIPPCPAFLVDHLGNQVTIEAQDVIGLEHLARQLTSSMGMSAVLAFHAMEGKRAAECVVKGSISRALELGQQLLPGERRARGTIVDVSQTLAKGFLEGFAILEEADGAKIRIDFQNEYLRVLHNDLSLACTPEIITLLEQDSGKPIPSERLGYGLRVDLICLSPPPIWETPEGLELVGPQVFGYDVQCPGKTGASTCNR